MSPPKVELTLAEAGRKIVELFEKVTKIKDFSDPALAEKWPKEYFANEADRFELWAVNLGLFVSGHGSLAYRLRDAETLHSTVQRFLSDLTASLIEVLEYCAGDPSEPALDNSDLSITNRPYSEFLETYSDQDSSEEHENDVDLLLDSVRDPIDRLFKLSTRIRNPSSRIGSSKALHFRKLDPDSGIDLLESFYHFDVEYVRSVFLQYRKQKAVDELPSVKRTINIDEIDPDNDVWEPVNSILLDNGIEIEQGYEHFLVNRIAMANVKRRQQFAYWKHHRGKLAYHTENAVAAITMPQDIAMNLSEVVQDVTAVDTQPFIASQSVTTASRLNANDSLQRNEQQSVVSVSEYAPSAWKPGKEVVEFPPVPKHDENDKFFECPYCFTICPAEMLADKAWKAHIIHDLRPYLCTYQDCRSSNQQFDSIDDWIEHESTHRKLWRCPDCHDHVTQNSTDFRDHLKQKHHQPDGYPLTEQYMVAAETFSETNDRGCPVCSMHLESPKAFHYHVARHMERFSLFSLPKSVNQAVNAEADGDSDKANTAWGGSRDDDFEHNTTSLGFDSDGTAVQQSGQTLMFPDAELETIQDILYPIPAEKLNKVVELYQVLMSPEVNKSLLADLARDPDYYIEVQGWKTISLFDYRNNEVFEDGSTKLASNRFSVQRAVENLVDYLGKCPACQERQIDCNLQRHYSLSNIEQMIKYRENRYTATKQRDSSSISPEIPLKIDPAKADGSEKVLDGRDTNPSTGSIFNFLNKKKTRSSPSETDSGEAQTLSEYDQSTEKQSGSVYSRLVGNNSAALGLNVIYSPKHERKVDIIFVHGLHGHSVKTWTKNNDPKLFWPLEFLPKDPVISDARILTFGYNSNLQKSGPASTKLNMLDFAKSLLFDMKYAKDEEHRELGMGKCPIAFVAHSTGGHIVKQAYITGQHDLEYAPIIAAVSGMAFLATPHRGANLDQVLERLEMIVAPSTSRYKGLGPRARDETLQTLNEQFRLLAPKLNILSFYETIPTGKIQGSPNLILEKEASVLGYPGEITIAMNANHISICKYDSPDDVSYMLLRDMLSSMIDNLITRARSAVSTTQDDGILEKLQTSLHVDNLSIADRYASLRDICTPNTNIWILSNDLYLEWLSGPGTTRILWLTGGPGTGKSVMAASIVDDLVQKGLKCQYFLASDGSMDKRSVSYVLRVIAYQVIQSIPELHQKFAEEMNMWPNLIVSNPAVIWRLLYDLLVFKHMRTAPIYWIIDGIDELDDPGHLLSLFASSSSSPFPIRILILGRKTLTLENAFRSLSSSVHTSTLTIEGHSENLYQYIDQNLNLNFDQTLRQSVIQKLLHHAQNSFLWLHFAISEINCCYRRSDIDSVFDQLPPDIETLYDRMATNLTQQGHSRNFSLITKILQVVTCSLRKITISELPDLLGREFDVNANLGLSINALSGGFVVANNDGAVSLIHMTARDYLLGNVDRPLHIEATDGHKHLFVVCMQELMQVKLRTRLGTKQEPILLDYSVHFWFMHLICLQPSNVECLQILERFLSGVAVLTWIHTLALKKELHTLLNASRCLYTYANNARKQDAFEFFTRVEFIRSWASDFIKLVARFGQQLEHNPEAVYKIIPPFCSKKLPLYQSFGKQQIRTLSVSGLSENNLDATHTRLSLSGSSHGKQLSTGGTEIAILTNYSDILFYDSKDFRETERNPPAQNETVYSIAMNMSGTLLATYSSQTTKIWEINSTSYKCSVENSGRGVSVLLEFSSDSTSLIVGYRDLNIFSWSFHDDNPTWQHIMSLRDDDDSDNSPVQSATCMAIDSLTNLIAVVNRHQHLSVWDLEAGSLYETLQSKDSWQTDMSLMQVTAISWYPHTSTILGLCLDGLLFKWNVENHQLTQISTDGCIFTLDNAGRLCATGDSKGGVKVYDAETFSLLYQYRMEDATTALSFGVDSRYLYDLRGGYANVMDMQVCGLLDDTGGSDIATGSMMSRNSKEPTIEIPHVDPITVLAIPSRSSSYTCGTDEGLVKISHNEKLMEIHRSSGHVSVEHIVYSDDAQLLCFSDSAQRVYINSTNDPFDSKGQWHITSTSLSPITQIFFSLDSAFIFLVTNTFIQVLAVDATAETRRLDLSTSNRKWIIHPHNADYLLGFSVSCVDIWEWRTSKLIKRAFTWSHSTLSPLDPDPTSSIGRILTTQDQKHVLVQIILTVKTSRKNVFAFFDIASTLSIQNLSDEQSVEKSLQPLCLPDNLASRIKEPLDFLSSNRLVYLSNANYICTVRLNPLHILSLQMSILRYPAEVPEPMIKEWTRELFPIPSDWLSPRSLALSGMWKQERCLLWPKNGEIAVVRSVYLV